MRKHCRNRVRSRGKLILNSYNRMVAHFTYLQASTDWREWQFRTISQRQAELLVASGDAERIVRMKNGAVQTVGYRALKPTTAERPSATALTMQTTHAVAKHALGGRLTRRERDEVEKFTVWRWIGDRKATLARVTISGAAARSAERQMLTDGRRAA